MKKVLVMGGAGFLGSHVADALSKKGYQVTIFDCERSPFLKENQKQLIGNILNQEDVDKAIRNHDIVYHLAGIADITECNENPALAIETNIMGTTYVLEACVKHKIEKIVFASSAYVYSAAGSFYRISKQSCELLIEEYAKQYDLSYVIIRYGSLYGSRANRKNTVYRIIEDALSKQEIEMSGTGEEKREFIHVLDASELSVKILDDEYKNQNIILTGPASISYSELLNLINEILQNKLKINFTGKSTDTHYKMSPYTFNPKIGRKLMTNPQIDLGQGILSLMDELYVNPKDINQ